MGWPHGHSLVEVRFHLCRVPGVFPTSARALLRDTQSFFAGRFLSLVARPGILWPRSGNHPIHSIHPIRLVASFYKL